jgi:hypothetical protein
MMEAFASPGSSWAVPGLNFCPKIFSAAEIPSPLVRTPPWVCRSKGTHFPKLIGYEAKGEPMVRLTLADSIHHLLETQIDRSGLAPTCDVHNTSITCKLAHPTPTHKRAPCAPEVLCAGLRRPRSTRTPRPPSRPWARIIPLDTFLALT